MGSNSHNSKNIKIAQLKNKIKTSYVGYNCPGDTSYSSTSLGFVRSDGHQCTFHLKAHCDSAVDELQLS